MDSLLETLSSPDFISSAHEVARFIGACVGAGCVATAIAGSACYKVNAWLGCTEQVLANEAKRAESNFIEYL